ncbi:MAG: sodium:solute symporter [Bacteroidales bacterium]|nr:sodium:solute symporter [Bacteroidales bacterium]
MSPIAVIITISAYFLVLFGVSYLAGRKADNADFFIGNRSSKWYMVAFAMIGATISGVTFMSVPGMVDPKAFSYMQMVLGFFVGQLIISFVLIPVFYRMKLFSIYEYLDERFGVSTYKTGAWFFFISKVLGASVRLFLVCLFLQMMVFGPLNIPFIFNVIVTVVLVWLYTRQGGVKTLIWTDSLKTFCLILSVVLTIYFIAKNMNLNFSGMIAGIRESDLSRTFFFDNPKEGTYFWKQFLAGIFTMIATTGLDQDFMQRNLSCENPRDSQKNIITSGLVQLVINLLFLMLGVLLYLFIDSKGIARPEKSDELFPIVATQGHLPLVVGVLFIIGLISSAYAAAGSALTALTTSFTVDILGIKNKTEAEIRTTRKKVHVGMAVVMGLVIFVFNILNNTSVIDAVYILASYTYGPILGLFAFGILFKRSVKDKFVPYVAVLAPIFCFFLQKLTIGLWGFHFGYALIIVNALFTMLGMWMIKAPLYLQKEGV